MDGGGSDAQPALEQRLIEGWLPLAAAANQCYGWELTPLALEELIRRAAPQLGAAQSTLAAYAVLWAAHTHEHSGQHR